MNECSLINVPIIDVEIKPSGKGGSKYSKHKNLNE